MESEARIEFVRFHVWERSRQEGYRCRACGEETDTPTLFGCKGVHSSRPARLLTLAEQRREEAYQKARLGR